MKYLYDVYVNYFNEKNPYLVNKFHEWHEDDEVQLLDQTVLLKVNDNLFNYIEYGFRKIPEEVLSKIKHKTYLRKNHEKIGVEYAFVATDGKRTIAVQCESTGRVEKKSKLLPRQHFLALELVEGYGNDFVLNGNLDLSKYDKYIGLTRYERENLINVKNYIGTMQPEKLALLKYLVSEFDNDLHKHLSGTFDEIKHRLLEEIKGSEIERLLEFNKVIDKVIKVS